MRIPRIFFHLPLFTDTEVILPLESSHYIMNVLRLKQGHPIILFHGDGNDYEAIITELNKKSVVVRVGECKARRNESPLKIHLAQAVSRSEKMDLAIQKAVELGVFSITPLLTEYSNVKLDRERTIKRHEHWKKIIISACEQSGRSFVPHLEFPINFDEWIKKAHAGLKLFCDPRSDLKIANLAPPKEVVILIGPEGGLSPTECDVAKTNNFSGVTLGSRILRTETAALAVIAILQNRWGDL